MRRLIAWASIAVVVVCAGCGGDSHESLAKESQAKMTEVVALLEGVKDSASAKAARPKLKSLAEAMNGINERMSKLPAPTEAEIAALESKLGKETEDLALKMQGQLLRITFDPSLMSELQDVDLGGVAR